MTDKEFQERLEQFETDLLSKVEQSLNHKKGWLYNNISWLITLLSTIAVIGVAWGTISTEVNHVMNLTEANAIRIENVDLRVRAHHENTDVHVDREWKSYVTRQLEDIRSLIVKHMARDVR